MNAGAKLAIAHDVMSALIKSGHISVINWLYTVDDELPDDDVRVFVAIPDRDGPVDAYYAGDRWIEDETGEHMQGVYAWGHIPELPPLPKLIADEGGAA